MTALIAVIRSRCDAVPVASEYHDERIQSVSAESFRLQIARHDIRAFTQDRKFHGEYSLNLYYGESEAYPSLMHRKAKEGISTERIIEAVNAVITAHSSMKYVIYAGADRIPHMLMTHEAPCCYLTMKVHLIYFDASAISLFISELNRALSGEALTHEKITRNSSGPLMTCRIFQAILTEH